MYNPDARNEQEDGEGMSIIDLGEPEGAGTSKSNLFISWMKKYGVYLLLVTIALLRGAAYANLLPPWAIIDEEQHLHYVQMLSEEGRRPDPREDYLSSEIITSLFETRRWDTFGFVTPPSHDPRDMGLEGYSYEGYQPPLYYWVMLPVYRLVGGSMLQSLFNLRWATVVLSTLTVVFTYLLAAKVTGSKWLGLLAALVLLAIPERTVAVSRVNNDALLEVLAVLYLWVAVRSIMEGPSDRRSILLGLILALGVLTKMTMALLVFTLPFVFWPSRKTYSVRRGLILGLGSAAVLILPLIIYNIGKFGDPTGFAAVSPLLSFPPPGFSTMNFIQSLRDFFAHFWVIFWQSAESTLPPGLTFLYILLFLLSGVSLYGLVKVIGGVHRKEGNDRHLIAVWMLTTAVIIYVIFTLFSFWKGQVPILQGRFLLSVSAAVAVLLILGLSRAPYPAITIPALIIGLVLMDVFVLFGHLLPQYYPEELIPQIEKISSLTWFDNINAFIQRTGSFKPNLVSRALHATMVGYILAQSLVIGLAIFSVRKWLRYEAE